MDSNKDEGLRCMRIGKSAMEAGDRSRALKFLKMAKRIYPNAQVDAMLRQLVEGDGPAAEKDSGSGPSVTQARDSRFNGSSNGSEENGDRVAGKGRERTNGFSGSRSSTFGAAANGNGIPRSRSTTALPDASPEQIEIVRRIRKTKDYYEILGLTKTCSDGDVRKAYRKLSLKVHPDKNSAAGAEDAFKAVSKAFQVLSDMELREKYDRDGPEEDIQVRHRHPARQYGGNPVYYEDAFDPNDIFNSFFFGMQQHNGNFRRTHFVRAQPPQWAQGGGQRGETHSINLLGLLQLLPILILLIVSLFPFSQPVFNLSSVAPYQIQQKTRDHEVRYYVKSHHFDKEYPLGVFRGSKLKGRLRKSTKTFLYRIVEWNLGYEDGVNNQRLLIVTGLRNFNDFDLYM